jgi:NADH dehydrogenase (ubiquinone) 1 alpha subcomplex subunit 4
MFRKWVPVETYPIVAVVSGAVAGAGFYLYRLSQGPEVTWNRHGDWRPWDQIKQDQNVSQCSGKPCVGESTPSARVPRPPSNGN